MQLVFDFFNHPIFKIVGGITVITATLGVIYRIISIVFGVSPIIFRIGKALWSRKIAIIGTTESYTVLYECISDSGVFKRKNIQHITIENIDKAKEHSVILVDWESSGVQIDDIFMIRKSHNTAVIIYAKAGSIPRDKMAEIANKSNTVVVNFKGRLLNDILSSLITTSF